MCISSILAIVYISISSILTICIVYITSKTPTQSALILGHCSTKAYKIFKGLLCRMLDGNFTLLPPPEVDS